MTTHDYIVVEYKSEVLHKAIASLDNKWIQKKKLKKGRSWTKRRIGDNVRCHGNCPWITHM